MNHRVSAPTIGVALALACTFGCSDASFGDGVLDPQATPLLVERGSSCDTSPWNRRAKLPKAIDTNPDPRVFETTLVASEHSAYVSPTQLVDVFAYNGSLPGPLIEVAQGDRVIVHLQNDLPAGWNTSIHWHGIEGDNDSDGTPVTQLAVEPGDTFTYDFVVPRAGTFWYHPHARSTQAVFNGLYGALVVKSSDEEQLVANGTLPAAEATLVLSDLTDVGGNVRDLEGPLISLEAMNGTEGETLLVNGAELPRIKVRKGDGIRLRLINTSIARYYRLAAPGHQLVRYGGEGGLLDEARVEGGMNMGMAMDMPMKMCMTDADCATNGSSYETCMAMAGAPMKMCGEMQMLDSGYAPGEILLAPGQRAEVVLVPRVDAGDELRLVWRDFARGRHAMDMEMPMRMCSDASDCVDEAFPNCMDMGMGGAAMCGHMHDADDDGTRPDRDVLRIKLRRAKGAPRTFEAGTPLLTALGSNVEVLGAANVDFSGMAKRVNFEGAMDENGTHFAIDGVAWEPAFGTVSLPPVAPSARYAALGDVIRFEVHNHTAMHHPFHLHGFSFQPTHFAEMHHDDGWMVHTPYGHAEFLDTVDVPPHTSMVAKVRLDDPAGDGSALGRWLFHCHILQHAARGMASELIVSPAP